MTVDRRKLLTGAGLLAAAPLLPQLATAQQATAPSVEQRLTDLALQNLHPMSFQGGKFTGPGWDLISSESATSEFVLFGEEHGMVETPQLVRELFLSLRPHGFDTLGIEISPPIAEDLDKAARGGIEGIKAWEQANPPGPAFFFWRHEAELIAAVRAAVPGNRNMLWGVDYEVAMDRLLIKRLWDKTGAAKNQIGSSLTKLDIASQGAWKTWRDTKNPGALFTFSGDPQLVRNVRAAWPKPDADVQRILTTLEETLEINKLYVTNKGYESNERRSALMRANFVSHLNRAAAEGRKPKALFKMGENHMMRGVSWTGNFDIGSLIQEAAAMRGGKAFALLCGGGQGSHHGVIDPTVFATRDAPVDMLDQMGMTFLLKAFTQPGPQVVDLRPMRRVLSSTKNLTDFANPEAFKVIFAFDALVIWNGSTATKGLLEA